jgi:hypothetical protein
LFVLALQANERRPETPEPPLVRVTDLLEFKVRGVNAAVIQRKYQLTTGSSPGTFSLPDVYVNAGTER